MAAIERCTSVLVSSAENDAQFDSLLKKIKPAGETILNRARNYFNMRYCIAPKPQSWWGWAGSFANPLVKACFSSVDPNQKEAGLWLRCVRGALDTLGPIFVPKPAGVSSEEANFFRPIPNITQTFVSYVELGSKKQSSDPHKAVKGEWVRPSCYDPARPMSERKVVIYLPGGAYHVGSRHTHGAITGRIARDAHCEVCVVEYGLLPEHAYPKALNDVLTVYNQLLSQGYKAENIILAGDSAGGHLATVAVHHIQREIKAGRFKTDSGLACNGLVLISPVVDFNLKRKKYQKPDPILPHDPMPLTAKNLHRCVSEHLTDSTQNILEHPVVSPSNVNLEELGNVHPPVFFSYGKEEVLGVGANDFYDKLKKAGIPVLQDVGEIIHAGHMASGYLPEAAAMMADVNAYIAHSLQTGEHQEADIKWAVEQGGYMNVEGFPL